jgi:hypothetical protein
VTRGRPPLKAQEKAFSIAEKRGLVQRYQHRRGNTCNFSIMSPGLVSFVTVQRLERLTALPEDILYDFAVAIGLLRFIASSPDISRELWLRTPHGAWRFFRILDNGIIELDRDGRVLAPAVKGPAAKPAASAAKKAEAAQGTGKIAGKSGQGVAGKNPVPDSVPAKDPDANLTTAKESETKRDLKSSVIPEKYAKREKDPEQIKNAEPVKDPGPEKDSVPDPSPPKMPEPEKDLTSFLIPEKLVVLLPDPWSAADPVQPLEPEKVPEIIKKFLKRRNKCLEKDPETE